jgi:hypothetical protein
VWTWPKAETPESPENPEDGPEDGGQDSTGERTAFLPFLAAWNADHEPLVFLAPADGDSAVAGPYPDGVAEVTELDDKGKPTGVVYRGVAVGFMTPPAAGDVVAVSYRFD